MYQNLNYTVIIIQEYTNYKRFVNFFKKRNLPEINIPNQTVRSYMQNMKKKNYKIQLHNCINFIPKEVMLQQHELSNLSYFRFTNLISCNYY